jgi:hypothetical protein
LSAVPPPPVASPSTPSRRLHAVDTDDYFGRQPTPSSRLPDPQPLVENLARSVIEILAGAREIEQIARWMTEGVYHHLLRRVVLAARGRAARKVPAGRPVYSIGASRLTFPADGVVEATVLVHGRARTRAVAMRLEGLDSRWRATALHVL